ncbi:helix-hairpin-helix domain-containing protein [Aestuariicella sp. G3-2]|uniref:ComEA family DNA-binding protein n=1 Tax=Pseudomaricurvus albidus TaxID=2842452 RepID=UPI001C0B57C8|nr:helix-hairpin-helix domain-containing protein [Aestuariicella albida]
MKHQVSQFPLIRLAALLCIISLSPFSWAESGKSTQPTAGTTTPYTVNINTASAEEIADGLKGIGLKKAQAIVAYREAHGKFTQKESLTAVKGIGEATVAKNSKMISLK